MDILTHTLSGVAVGSCLALYAKGNRKKTMGILFFSGLGGALPDMDAISLWSRFDSTIGRLFQLSHPGKDIYSEKFWYSHHGFMHSLLAAISIAIVIGIALFLISRIRQKKKISFLQSVKNNRLLLCGFMGGFIIHLLEDMVTPGGSWGGVRLFFPFETYIGGTGDIWWWNNYDVFLIVLTVLVANLILLLFSYFKKASFGKAGIIIFAIGFIAATIQIKTRDYNFNGKPFQACEDKSKAIQQKLLGKTLYNTMADFDHWLIIYF